MALSDETFDTNRGATVAVVSPQRLVSAGGEDAVDSKTAACSAMHEAFKLVNDLREGTAKMRTRAAHYLPRFSGEKQQNYEARIKGSFLFKAYDTSVKRLASRPFNDRIRLKEDTPDEIIAFTKNVDGAGTNLSKFAETLLDDGVHHGVTGILVEFPAVDAQTAREVEGLMPVWELIDFDRVLGFRVGVRNGNIVPTQLRIYSSEMHETGQFSEVSVERIRVYSHSIDDEITVTHWLRVKGEPDYRPEPTIELAGVDRIPFVPYYTNKKGVLVGEPALGALAEKNLEHFQSASDQRNILHFVRAATIFRSGFTESEAETEVPIGANSVHTASNDKAKMQYVEHSGKGIESGEADLTRIEEQMVALGLEPLVRHKPGVEMTATEKAIDSKESSSMMSTWVRDLESAINRALDLTASWIDIPYESEVDVNDKFSVLREGDVRNLIELHRERALSKRALLRMLKLMGVLPETFDIQAELDEQKEDAEQELDLLPDPGPMPNPGSRNGPDPDDV